LYPTHAVAAAGWQLQPRWEPATATCAVVDLGWSRGAFLATSAYAVPARPLVVRVRSALL